ncbi:hypothetical protein ACLB2K_031156 [Fragaria x ananassa]
MLQDFLALQAAEKSLEDLLIQQYPPPTNPLLASSIELSAENSYDFINHSSNQLKGGKGGSNGKRTVRKKKDDNREVVDFQSQLTQCAKLRNLPEETEMNSPRDKVLKLIKRINPHVYIHGLVNGTYNTPFFTIRFLEALYHFPSMFDIFDETLPREDQQRLLYEQEILSRDIINVIACEGSRRLERPETYKQWQIRNTRAGFKQLPSNQEILTEVENMVKLEYHEDFIVEEDGKWIVQGCQGRILHAFSGWKPAS